MRAGCARLAFAWGVAGCGAGSPPACTAEVQGVVGAELAIDNVVSFFDESVDCLALISNVDQLSVAFHGQPPAELLEVDFGVDRVVLAPSNPALEFAVDDGTDIVIGLHAYSCILLAISCDGHVLRNTTHDVLVRHDCSPDERACAAE